MARKKANPTKAQETEPKQVRILINQPTGSSGLREANGYVQEAYNQKLYYPAAFAIFDRLRRSMPEMVMIRQAFSSWARNVKVEVDLPEDPTDDDKRYKDFIESDFENMEGGLVGLLDTMVNQVPFMGFGYWDAQVGIRDRNWKVPVQDDDWQSEADDGYIGLRRLAWRGASIMDGWEFNSRKKMIGMWQNDHEYGRQYLPLETSLHLTMGEASNPEGFTPMEAVWRVSELQYAYSVIHGIGSEHAAGFLNVTKTEKGKISASDKTFAKAAARAIMTAQEGNYAIFPYGLQGSVMDIPFSAATSLLEIIKYYSLVSLAVYSQQWIGLNVFTNTGALASQTSTTDTGIFTFNSMMDGFASQYDQQIGKRLFKLNELNFPNLTARPNIRFTHVKNTPKMQELGSFLRDIDGIIPLDVEDWNALRQQTEWMPETTSDEAIADHDKSKQTPPPPQNGDPTADGEDADAETLTEEKAQAAQVASALIRQSFRAVSSRRNL